MCFCNNAECENTACERNYVHAPTGVKFKTDCFRECEYYKKFLKALWEKEKQEAIEEAKRDAMKLDGNEDTLQWKGTHY